VVKICPLKGALGDYVKEDPVHEEPVREEQAADEE
jgi:hypothetical protein